MKGKKLTIAAVLLSLILCAAVGCNPKTEPTECVHSGGTATCTEQAVCDKCGEKYGELAAHKLGDWQTDGAEHWKECSVCHDKFDKAAHSGGTATCLARAVCSGCGTAYGNYADHKYGEDGKCIVCGKATYKFEAESAELFEGSKGMPGKNERDGVFVVHTLAGNEGAKVKFTVYSEFDKEAKLTVALAPLAADTKVTDVFDVTVNGTAISSDAVIAGYGETATQLSRETTLGEITLRDGTDDHSNVIEFTVKAETNGFDIFDYIVLETTGCELSAEYMAPTPNGHTHTYSSEWTYNDEYHWHAGNCDHTFKKSEYAKHSFDSNNECTVCGYTRSYKFEAEWGRFGAGNGGKPNIDSGTYVGGVNSNTNAFISFAIYSPEASAQRMFVNLTRRKDRKFSDGFALYVNRQEITTEAYNSAMLADTTDGSDTQWNEFGEADLGEISLVKGINYIMLVVKPASEKQGNIDYFKFQGSALVSKADKALYDGSELRYEAEFGEIVGGAFTGDTGTTSEGEYKSLLIDGINGLNREGNGVKFTVTSNGARRVKLVAAMTVRNADIAFNSYLNVFVNDDSTPITIDGSVMIPKADSDQWTTSAEVELGEIELVDGDNVISFISQGTQGSNFDYIKLVPVTE